MAEPERCPQDVFEILFASDVHLGFGCKDPVRGQDSQRTFEEILRVGRERGVDFVLLGGDLFHQSTPPKNVMDGAIRALRKYCLGDKKTSFDLSSELKGSCSSLNFKDQHLNVALPVFTIHGVHDDPAGIGARSDGLGILNVLHSTGLLNYFGKAVGSDEITIDPILLQKGITKLALFGLGAMNEGRLNRLYEESKVHLGNHPDGKPEDWFNVFVLHQNRVPAETEDKEGKAISEERIDPLMDLVIWGHEPTCQIEAEWNETQRFHVSQPGNANRIKLNDYDRGKKNMGLLRVATLLTPDGQEEKQFKIEKIPLHSVRQYYSREIKLADMVDINNTEIDVKTQVENICRHQIEEMISLAAAEHNGIQPKEPLVRLKVNRSMAGGTSTFETFNIHSFSQSFEGRVANPKDVIVICQRRPRHLNPYFPALKLPPTSTAKPEIKEEDGGQQNGVEEPMSGAVNGAVEGITNGGTEGVNGRPEGVNGRPEGVNGGPEEAGANPEASVNGGEMNGGGAEAMETGAETEANAATLAATDGETMKEEVKEEVNDEKPEISFYKEEAVNNDESLVDEVGAMGDLIHNYFKHQAPEASNLGIYTKEALTSAMSCFAEGNLTESLSQYIYKQLESVQQKMEEKLTLTNTNRDEVTSVLKKYVDSRQEGVMDESEQGVLDAAIKLAADRKAKILDRRFKEPEVEDMEVFIPPSARSKCGKAAAAKSKPTTVSKLSGAINERGIPYVVLNDLPDLPPRAPQPARKSRANRSVYVEQYSDEEDDEYRPVSPKKRRR